MKAHSAVVHAHARMHSHALTHIRTRARTCTHTCSHTRAITRAITHVHTHSDLSCHRGVAGLQGHGAAAHGSGRAPYHLSSLIHDAAPAPRAQLLQGRHDRPVRAWRACTHACLHRLGFAWAWLCIKSARLAQASGHTTHWVLCCNKCGFQPLHTQARAYACMRQAVLHSSCGLVWSYR